MWLCLVLRPRVANLISYEISDRTEGSEELFTVTKYCIVL